MANLKDTSNDGIENCCQTDGNMTVENESDCVSGMSERSSSELCIAVEQCPVSNVFSEDVIIADYTIQKEVANKAVSGHYINFVYLLRTEIDSESDVSSLIVTQNGIRLSKMYDQEIDSYNRWIEAMLNYESLLTSEVCDPQIHLKILSYRRYIHQLQLKFRWPYVYSYDKQFRMHLACKKTFDFHVSAPQLFLTVFDAKAVKEEVLKPATKKCFRCHSDHLVKACPFPQEAALAPQPAPPPQEAITLPESDPGGICLLVKLVEWASERAYTSKLSVRKAALREYFTGLRM